MPTVKDPWFVVDRSEAVAGLLLTSRDDVRVRSENKKDNGVDFLVEVNTGESLSTRLFVVQVKGTISSDKTKWIQGVEELFRASEGSFYLPACVFVVNVRDNNSWYAWIAEPLIEKKKASLRFLPPGDFYNLDRTAVDQIVERVKAWYSAKPH